MSKIYPSDATDEQWAVLEPLIPPSHGGRPRTIDIRRVVNGIFYRNRAGCQWRMLPKEYGPIAPNFTSEASQERDSQGDPWCWACGVS
jgi:transposase